MKLPISLKTITIISILVQSGCALNYPAEDPDAELFLPMIQGFATSNYEREFNYTTKEYERKFDYTINERAFRISKALEHHFIATNIDNTLNPDYCCVKQPTTKHKLPTFRITKILEPFNWQDFEDEVGIFRDAPPGGVLFGWGVELTSVYLLTLRYVLSPMDRDHYEWKSCENINGDKLTVDIPHRYIDFAEFSLSKETVRLFEKPMVIHSTETVKSENDTTWMKKCEAYDAKKKCDPACYVCDDIDVVIETEPRCISHDKEKKSDPACSSDDKVDTIIQSTPDGDTTITGTAQSKRLPIKGYRKIDVSFNDGDALSPVRYRFSDQPAEGWIDVINLSRFPKKTSYMDIVYSLMLAQAGHGDRAYNVYKEKIKGNKNLRRKNKEQVLFIIAHLHGKAGGDISTVLEELAEIRNPEIEDNDDLIENYKLLNMEKKRCSKK